MSKLTDYTEEKLTSRFKTHKSGSLQITKNYNAVTVTYETLNYDSIAVGGLGGQGGGAVAGAVIGSVVPVVGTAVGAVFGAFGGLIGGALIGSQFPATDRHEKIFDADTGEYLGETKLEAAKEENRRGVKKFVQHEFQKAEKYFSSSYFNTPAGSHEEAMAKANMNAVTSVLQGVELIEGEKYSEGRQRFTDAMNETSDVAMRNAISAKLKILAERSE
jgi:outer membrane lipoprotein SlyB